MAGESLRDSNPRGSNRSTPCPGQHQDWVQSIRQGQRAIDPLLPPPEWLVGLAVLPVLTGLVGVRVAGRAMAELGELAEEIFRGDRLPILTLGRGADPARPD